MGKTIIAKILGRNSACDAAEGMTVVCSLDKMMTNDASGPLSLAIMREHGYTRAADPSKIAIFMDHYTPCSNDKVAMLQQSLVDFVEHNPGIALTKTGYGICHTLMDEFGFVAPGRLIAGGDSHSTTYGFLNAAGVGVGSTDMAIAMITGKLWFKVPGTIRINFGGKLRKCVGGKDVGLHLVNRLGPNGGNYKAIEFGGTGVAALSINDRKTICNLMAECGAKCGIMPFDGISEAYCRERGIDHSGALTPDPDCVYERILDVDLSDVKHVVSVPHNVHTIAEAESLRDVQIDMALLGTCTGGEMDDFREAAAVLEKCKGNFKSEVIVVPASQKILLQMIEEGIAALLVEKGASILPAGCGPCCGSSPGVPRNGFNVISTANRNFIGRMGNVKSNIYLASPAVVAASAWAGRITIPAEVAQ